MQLNVDHRLTAQTLRQRGDIQTFNGNAEKKRKKKKKNESKTERIATGNESSHHSTESDALSHSVDSTDKLSLEIADTISEAEKVTF